MQYLPNGICGRSKRPTVHAPRDASVATSGCFGDVSMIQGVGASHSYATAGSSPLGIRPSANSGPWLVARGPRPLPPLPLSSLPHTLRLHFHPIPSAFSFHHPSSILHPLCHLGESRHNCHALFIRLQYLGIFTTLTISPHQRYRRRQSISRVRHTFSWRSCAPRTCRFRHRL